MEFRLAAEGNTEELRRWLRDHPERVNVPAADSHMTLLYTCISNCNRVDLASLQAGYSRYLTTVRMLCEEYKADVLAPNGGTHNTALHLAATLGATSILQYLVVVRHTPVDCVNAFEERPLQLAERCGHADCAALLKAAARETAGSPLSSSREVGPSRASTSAERTGGEHKGLGRFQRLTVVDSDEEYGCAQAPSQGSYTGLGKADAATSLGATASEERALRLPSSPPRHLQPPPDTIGAGSSLRISTAGQTAVTSSPALSAPQPADPAAVLSPPIRPRKEYDISSLRILANPDLQSFRSAFGNGFQYLQCSDHYEIRGMLPYTYRGTVYYTPVIISVYAPAANNDTSKSPITHSNASYGATVASSLVASTQPAIGTSPPHTTPALRDQNLSGLQVEVYCRFRVGVNMEKIDNLAISRKAEYLDPLSGAIIPAPGDEKFQTLTAYIRHVVVRNFEAVPPLIHPSSSYAFPMRPNVSQLGSAGGEDVYQHHHSHNTPSFIRDVLTRRTAAHIRCATILRDLSRFGDGLAKYFPEKHRIVAYVPLFSERKSAVLALAQQRAYPTTVGQNSPPPARASETSAETPLSGVDGAAAVGSKTSVTQQIAVEAIAELHVRVLIQFTPTEVSGLAATANTVGASDDVVYAYAPRLYLVDAAARPLTLLKDAKGCDTNTAACDTHSDSLTARCFAGMLKHKMTGEVRPELVSLSQEWWSANGSVYSILVELQLALRGVLEAFTMSHRGSVKPSSPLRRPGEQFTGSQATKTLSDSTSSTLTALDAFFASPTTPTPPPPNRPSIDNGASTSSNSAGHCLACFRPLHSSRLLLQPCGHDALCGLCVQRLQSHFREELFPCPVCRGTVRNVLEVLL